MFFLHNFFNRHETLYEYPASGFPQYYITKTSHIRRTYII